jgi:hypothetical protein
VDAVLYSLIVKQQQLAYGITETLAPRRSALLSFVGPPEQLLFLVHSIFRIMESIKGHPEYVETVFGEAIVARDESLVVLAGASGLGPPDLCWLQKAPKSALTGSSGESKGYYHCCLGVDASSSAAVAAYFATLTSLVEPPTFLQVRRQAHGLLDSRTVPHCTTLQRPGVNTRTSRSSSPATELSHSRLYDVDAAHWLVLGTSCSSCVSVLPFSSLHVIQAGPVST